MKISIKSQLINEVQELFPGNVFRYTDIIKTLIERVKGEKFDPVRDRGYYATNLTHGFPSGDHRGYLRKPSKAEPRFFAKVGDHWEIQIKS
jgi:hypothetical protein